MRTRTLLLGATALWFPATVLAQASAAAASADAAGTVTVGSRVRITSPEVGPEPLVGHVVGLEPGALVVGGKDGSHKQRVALAAAIGALGGLLTNIGDYNSDNHTLTKSVVAAASGAAVGALVGWAVKTDTWRPAKAPAVSAAILPVPRGAAFSVRVAWGQPGS
jgi:hypothetical protein